MVPQKLKRLVLVTWPLVFAMLSAPCNILLEKATPDCKKQTIPFSSRFWLQFSSILYKNISYVCQ
uniref:Uncharacterized protein n=1 Tax=Arundo donax TaxID=35708 RepID=A0A0A9AK44_ARUDO